MDFFVFFCAAMRFMFVLRGRPRRKQQWPRSRRHTQKNLKALYFTHTHTLTLAHTGGPNPNVL